MTRFSIALLLSTTMLGSAFADEFTFGSNVDAVTVFPSGAEVERVATGTLDAGTHTVLIENLPANISPDSVRVEGVSGADISIGSVDVKRVFLSQNDNAKERVALERQVEALDDEFRRLNQVVADTKLQRSMLEKLISNAGAPANGETGNALSALEVADLLDGAAQRLDKYAQRTIDAQSEQRSIQRQMRELQNQIAALAPREEQRSTVAINIDAGSAGDATFKVRYAIANAGWQPIYDASLTLGDGAEPSMDIVRRANVRQSTSESWDGVSLTLSTARPSLRTAAPELSPYEIDQLVALARKQSKLRSVQQSTQSGVGETLSYTEDAAVPEMEIASAPMARQEAVADFGGFQATYQIAGKVSIGNTGETKSVVMGEDSFEVDISAYTVPRLDPAAYLMADFTLTGEATYLPGAVLLSRDGAYIGRGTMPMLAPGDDHELSFGQDDFIIVERVETEKKEGETGLISASLTDERSAKTTITNLHNFAMEIKMLDRLPVANHEDITVTLLSDSTKPTTEDVDDKRGLVAWETQLDVGQSAVINFGYRVTWPKAMQISALD